MLKFFQDPQQFVARTAAHAIAADRLHRVGQSRKLPGVHLGILVIVDDNMRLDSGVVEGGEQGLEKSGFSRTQKTNDENQRSHASETAVFVVPFNRRSRCART